MQYSANESLDVLLNGRVKIIQRRDGYRVSEDALHLCRFIGPMPREVGIDLGTGCGIVAIALVTEGKVAGMVGLEIQEGLARIAERNVRLNRVGQRVRIRRGDIRRIEELFDPEEAMLVTSNPPYRLIGTGRLSPSMEKTIAKHEWFCTLEDVVAAADYVLAPQGVLAFCHLEQRSNEIREVLKGAGFEISRRESIVGSGQKLTDLLLVEAVRMRSGKRDS